MDKNDFLKMGYIELKGGEFDTLYKKFENGSMFIVEFNEDIQKDAIGKVHLTKEQIENIF